MSAIVPNLDNEALIRVRFEGEGLDVRSIPIYDLAQVLIATQRIINKGYLLKQDRLRKNQKLTQRETEVTALQLSEHSKGSDAYGFTTVLSDPVVTTIVVPLVLDSLMAVGSYAYKRVMEKWKEREKQSEDKKAPDQEQITQEILYEGSIYPQVSQIVNRIENISGIEIIEFYSEIPEGPPPTRFTTETKQYVREIRDQPFHGDLQDFEGTLRQLHPYSNIAIIYRKRHGEVKVRLKPDDFEIVRYQARRDTIIVFSGRPIYRLGLETLEFDEFDAHSVRLINT